MKQQHFLSRSHAATLMADAVVMAAAMTLAACTTETVTMVTEEHETVVTGEHIYSQDNLLVVENDTAWYDASQAATPFSDTDKNIGTALEDYAVTMLSDYSKGHDGNTHLSPMSATQIYSMMINLTDNDMTVYYQQQMNLECFTLEQINDYCRKMNYQSGEMENLNTDNSKFNSKSNCWIQQNEKVYQSFVSITQSFGIGVKGVDFNSTHGQDDISETVNSYMPGSAISDGAFSPQGGAKSLATTSMKLQKKWKHKMKMLYGDSLFANADGTVAKYSKFGATITANYLSTDCYDMVELPYTDENFSLYLVYPHEADGLEQSLSDIRQKGLEQCLQSMNFEKLSVLLPSFKYEGTTSLNTASQINQQGMQQIHQQKLRKASPDGFAISNVVQAYSIDLNQHGISVEVTTTAEPMESSSSMIIPATGESKTGGEANPIPTVHVNHPFAVFIRNNRLRSIVYACSIKTLGK